MGQGDDGGGAESAEPRLGGWDILGIWTGWVREVVVVVVVVVLLLLLPSFRRHAGDEWRFRGVGTWRDSHDGFLNLFEWHPFWVRRFISNKPLQCTYNGLNI